MRPPRVDADPSEEPQPGKAKSEYRNYTEGKLLDRVYTTYLLMHTHQTVDFVRRKSAEYGGCSLRRMSVMEALELLDQLVDESDPDVDFPNSFHAYQTAEGIRRAHPDKDWFHLVGLLHDMGKVLALFGEPQVSGATGVRGDGAWHRHGALLRPPRDTCRRPAVGRGGGHLPRGLQGAEVRGLLRLHLPREPRQQGPPVQVSAAPCPFGGGGVRGGRAPRRSPEPTPLPPSTECGMYQPHCGLENVLMSWGHDEYMYRVMKFNNFALPKEVRAGGAGWAPRGAGGRAPTAPPMPRPCPPPAPRPSTWFASTPSTRGTRTGTTGTSAARRTCACCPGSRSSTSSTSTPSRRSCPMCRSCGATTSPSSTSTARGSSAGELGPPHAEPQPPRHAALHSPPPACPAPCPRAPGHQ
uniref:Inositol oxygenase n=1 Tax=Anser brachyrhynchus TaxID=132585 RepID=A0A8B9D0J7_9AVES